jgi:uncharacterized protein
VTVDLDVATHPEAYAPEGPRIPGPAGIRTDRTRQRLLDELLRELGVAVPDISGAVIASGDGLPIAGTLEGPDLARIAAMTASVIGLSTRATETAGVGCCTETVIRGVDGYLVVYGAGDGAALSVSAKAGANLGLLHLEARDAAIRLGALLAG